MTAILAFIVAHWAIISACLVGLSTIISSIATVLTNSPKDESVLNTVLEILSFLEHSNIGGIKIPGTPAKKPPVVGLEVK